MNNFLVFDLETNTKEMYGRKASPFYNDIVAIGLATATEEQSYYIYPHKLTEFKIDEDILVGFNMTFDLLYLWHLDDLTNFFKRGGKVWDCQLAEFILSGQQHKYPALRDIAVSKYNCPFRDKVMEPYWAKDIDTKDIPIDLVISDVVNDVKDTRAIYLQQLIKAEKLGMLPLIQERMDGLLACIEMEYNGMYIDQQKLEANQEELLTQVTEVEKDLDKLIRKYWNV